MTTTWPADPPRRARSLDELRALGANFRTAAGFDHGVGIEIRPDDVIISPYAKCGTTWLQQIVHGLRSGGSMDFDEITEVVPWLEMAHDMGVDPAAPQVAAPRAFKSHLPLDMLPDGARYLCALRDPADAVVSLFRFFDGWRLEPGSVSLDRFALDYFLSREDGLNYWHHALSWWRARQRDDVLLLCYEDMLDDHAGTVTRIAGFMGIDASPETLAIAEAQSTMAFMKAHERQFDDHLLREARDEACGLPAGGHSTKVNRGGAGSGRATLGPEVFEALDGVWRERITETTGLADYAAMRASLGSGA